MADAYWWSFAGLVALEREISANAAIFSAITVQIDELAGHMVAETAEGLGHTRATIDAVARRSTAALILATAFGLVAGVAAAIYIARTITTPLNELSQTAQALGRGDLERPATVSGPIELTTLAEAFNAMAARLRELIGSLEQRVASRTHALEITTVVSRRLSTILDRDELVSEVVRQVRDAFNYYHAHIYLLDEKSERLVMVGGTGRAGREMLARGHRLKVGQGLVGRAAETSSTVLAPDVTAEPGWLPNELLPETKGGVAVPITLGNRVLGVLDVQHNEANRLSEEDANLLQAIANQVAIALQNAQLYSQARSRAEQESLINAISQQIQQATTVESALQIAARELGRAAGVPQASARLRSAGQEAPLPGRQD
jgi:nitrate/nitrite-specific signal transduction histidine kinase